VLIMWMMKIFLAIEIIVLSGRYIEEHTEEWIYEREITTYVKNGESVYGIGFEPEKGEWFWFHRKTEILNE